ncbi:MAG: hypothetical protein US04_C0001G0045 [Candidatus Nomurabacteria bacterium GW2011_GWD2_36_14]|nr:MAG: hypothetical protein UR97_C0007G0021 [Candidatus Nomurabacteria bacterium GW2011_GWE2_36_115]KKP93425.1 MAG: hypothetical protein US00_C0007G0047 [Candidatus Nomurabacteria bacterium GW2011_GWF2_36_126]KKP96543.1 MAG: hypothetical protein US04_C0001G0045 [Candidatus Nomurabacteria bacterium GW2011_GWD2_36_14]KKP99853.1 MAG: hypothetical protein US08_C0001G0536 [Candidatus Nomurabacteria bacterium GW2011_GWF2_36_19]KKQ05108.1 MAG: hypothetical protein US17_C0007G0021 [Candidatus Nomuraba
MPDKIQEIGKRGSVINLVVFNTNPKREIFRDHGNIKLAEPITPGSSIKEFSDDSGVGFGVTNTVRSIEPSKEEGKYIVKTVVYRECEVTLLN